MTEDQYLSLCEKYFKGMCTPKEEHMLSAYQDTHGMSNLSISKEDEERLGKILRERVNHSIKAESAKNNPLRIKWQAAAAIAASLLVFVYFGSEFFNAQKNKDSTALAVNKKIKNNDILPGSEQAVLTLANGESIKLDSAKNGVIGMHGDAHIAKSGNGLVISANGKNTTNVLNRIMVPRGGRYDIILPDGTHVWLNSASSLSFPTAFAGKERKVLLTGEAYFEVTKDKRKPFKVEIAGKQEVEVLGTHFNITAFDGEQDINTTLLEGMVKINCNKSSTLIKPGQMAINNPQQKLKVVTADVDEVMAWKNDMFIFNNENIVSIMKKISRWYDVDVEYRGAVSGVNFDGNYSRSKGLKSLLKNIELTDKVRFVTEGRRVIVIVI
ncbi:FecR family protein [Pedobacter sp. GSP4]|uniref:FecR family protein n=1 Tax=Pedobacter sp. GSP4 TaxID=3453716 RepID=UPI003EEEE1CF